MVKVIDNSDQSPLFLKKMFPLLVILGWAITWVPGSWGEAGSGESFLLVCPQTGMEQ